MTTPGIDSILSAISASPAAAPSRSPRLPDSFQELLRLQPYEPAASPVGGPERRDIHHDDEALAADAKVQSDDESAASAEDPTTDEEQCIIDDCGVRTAEASQTNDSGEAQDTAVADAPRDEAPADGQKQQRVETHAEKRPVAQRDVADQPTAPAQPASGGDADALVTNQTSVLGEPAATATEQKAATADEAAVAVGEKPADKQPTKVASTERQAAKTAELTGKSTAGEAGQAAAAHENAPREEGDRRRGRDKPAADREIASPNPDAPARRAGDAEARIALSKPPASSEAPPAAADPPATSPPPGETSPATSPPPSATIAPTAHAQSGERLSATLGKPPAADRPSGTALSQAQQARLVQRVAKAFDVAQSRGETTIRLRLSPPQLGSLRLEVQLDNGALTARLEVETHAAREALVDNLHALRERLAEQNIRVENFDVGLSDRRHDGPHGRGGDNSSAPRDDGRQRSNSGGRTTAKESTEQVRQVAVSAWDDKNIDVVI